ncbi:MAG: adenylyl-sulfate kinase [Porticoccaceae bacterium]|nr:adenylyl-sulfate kinase [Porticoccaceae bacterium]
MADQILENIQWQEGEISRADRERLIQQKGTTIWFTGLSGSGKSTIAIALEKALYQRNTLSYRLDGDNIRLGINKNLGFSAVDRAENIRRIGEISKLFSDCGAIALSSFISPYRQDRENVRTLHEESGIKFIEVFVDCSLEVAETRDPKGLYKKARDGKIKNFTGIDDPYETPKNPEIHLRTDQLTLEQEIKTIILYLEQQGIIN